MSNNQELGDKQGMAWAWYGLGSVAYRQRDFDRAERMLQRTMALDMARHLECLIHNPTQPKFQPGAVYR